MRIEGKSAGASAGPGVGPRFLRFAWLAVGAAARTPGRAVASVLVAYVEAWSRHRETSDAHRRGRASTREVFDCCTMWLRLCQELQLTPAAEAKLEIERAKLAAHRDAANAGPYDGVPQVIRLWWRMSGPTESHGVRRYLKE